MLAPRADDADRAPVGDSSSELDMRVAAKECLTGALGVGLVVVFAAEGLTILLQVRSTVPTHAFIGMLLISPVVMKTSTTGYRFGLDAGFVELARRYSESP